MSTAREFLASEESKEFKEACARVYPPVKPTRRQVRKWRRKTGAAYQSGRTEPFNPQAETRE